MAKFVIECPNCGAYHEGSTGFFSKKRFLCTCGREIDIKKDKFKTVICESCSNTVIFDQTKLNRQECPICHKKLVTNATINNNVTIHCPTCMCELNIAKETKEYDCPLCETKINVEECIKKEEITKKGLASIIRYEGDNETFIFKHPIENFNYGSQLIVHESQEAIFFKDGKALDSFKAGRHTLETSNLPILTDLLKKVVGGNEIFHTEVYFINLTTQTGIKWGTSNKIKLFDPQSGMHIEIGAAGEFNVKVVDGRRLLLNIVGTNNTLKQADLFGNDYSTKSMNSAFRNLILSKIKSNLASSIKENNINILEIDSMLEYLSNILKNKINESLTEYGLLITEFNILNIMTPDDDPNFKKMKQQYAEEYLLVKEERIKANVARAAHERRIIEAQTGAQEEIIQAQAASEAYRLRAQAEAQEMQMKGYTYEQETKRQIGIAAMENMPQGSAGNIGGVVSDVIGLGVTMGTVKSVVGMTTDVISPVMNTVSDSVGNSGWSCSCGQMNIKSNFCPNCGSKKPQANNSWNCSCGQMNILSNFCPNCGSKNPNMAWDCSCGEKNIKSNFCPNCGNKKL